jgi:hypothetical protein
MNSWKLFGTASAAAFAVACTAAYGQSCGSPLTANLGSTPVATTSGVTLSLTGLCDPGPFGDDNLYNVTWYAFTAPNSAQYKVSTCNSVNFDSRLAVLTNCSVPSSVLACNDDGPAGCLVTGTSNPWASELCFTASAGTTYYIAVGGFASGTNGSGSMTISEGCGGGGGGICSASSNDCCSPNTTPFCSDSDCCNTVCQFDPFCCETEWDSQCAGEASEFCASCGGGGSGCGQGSQSCCVANAGPYCSDASCCNTVCGFDPWCCNVQWDAICADEAASNCAACNNSGAVCGVNTQDCCVASGNNSAGCADVDCCTAVCAADPFCCNVFWDAICANEASFMCASCVQECTGPAATHIEQEPCGSNTNGGCGDPNNPVPPEPINLGDIISGTFWSSPSLRDTDWYIFTLTEGTQVTLTLWSAGPAVAYIVDYSSGGGTCSASVIAGSATSGCPRTATACLPAGTYVAFAAMSVFANMPCGSDTSAYTLEVSGVPCSAEPPANDECTGAVVLPPSGGSSAFDTTFASTSAPPLPGSCNEGFGTSFVKDVWFSWTPNQSGAAYASTCNAANFDTRIAVYTDCPASNLVACNDDATGCGLTSRAEFSVTSGTTYYVRVGGYSGPGTGTVTVGYMVAPPNDECSGAVTVTNGVTPFDTTSATTSFPGLPAQCDEGFGLAFGKDVWFKYVATCSQTVTVSTCNDASFDTRLAAYTDCNDTLVACNDDGTNCGLTSKMEFPATQGTTYYIRVGGYGNASGTGNLTISCGSGGGGLTNDDCSTPTVATSGANAFTNVGATSGNPNSSPAFCGAFGTGFYNDVWFSYTATTSGTATFSTCNTANFDTRLELWNLCPGSSGATLLACNDDGSGCSGFTSLMTYDLVCNTTYLVRVGAYSTGGFGSGTLTITPGTGACGTPCPWDIDGNGIVNGADLGQLLANWGNAGTGDFDGNGIVNGADLGALLSNWGPCPQ